MTMFGKSNFPRGSEWRRWDLHVHTPESKLGTSFTGVSWNEYVDALEAAATEKQIAVIGVTDYLSVDGYERLLAEQLSPVNPRLKGVSMLLPNIEFRALPATSDNKAINIHILVDPRQQNHIQQIRRAMRNLRVQHGKESYGCIKEELVEYGRVLNPKITDDEAAYAYGIQQFKPGYQELSDWLDGEGWLRENCLVGVSNGKDGISGLPLDGFSATREQLLKACDFVFSGNPSDRDHYLGKKAGTSSAEIVRMYRSLKPCLHGSDAHEISRLFVPDKDRSCWIKSDPTFEGLRQVLWEPEARVHIGKVSPSAGDSTRYIQRIRLNGLTKWFDQTEIELNSGLVAVIGEKGAGKTAIADLLAFGGGYSVPLDSQSSFLVKGRIHLQKGKVTLQWGNGTETTGELTDKPYGCEKPLVRYLSQDFVERLCSTDNEGRELQKAIEEVVFSHLDESQREGFSSFDQLRDSRELASQAQQDELRGRLASLHREVERLEHQISQIPAKMAFKLQLDAQATALREQLPQIESLAEKDVLELLVAEKKKLTALENLFSSIIRRRRKIEDFGKSYSATRERAIKSISDLIESTAILEITPGLSKSQLYPAWDPGVEQSLADATAKLNNDLAAIAGSEEGKRDGDSIRSVSANIAELQERVSKDETSRKQLLDVQKQIEEKVAGSKRIDKEISELEKKTKALLSARRDERNEAFANYFSSLAENAHGLEELYGPMRKQIERLGADMKFELRTGTRLDIKGWLASAARFYDGRRAGAGAKRDLVEKFAQDELAPALHSGDPNRIKEMMRQFYTLVDPPKFMAESAVPSIKSVDLYDWMYSTDHFGITYKILYDGIELEHLSPGTRGIALLVLYLLMDEDDRRPLIIDQPEGNLDNASVFSQLVPYIRRAKEKRQIVLITHNPNLVVATDAEQVVIATADRPKTQSHPRINYLSGSLEHTSSSIPHGTRQAVCLLLEGGETAFRERESRYAIARH